MKLDIAKLSSIYNMYSYLIDDKPSAAAFLRGQTKPLESRQQEEGCQLGNTCSNFGTNLFFEVSENTEAGENILLSPLSVYNALQLVTDGATTGSETKDQLEEVIGLTPHINQYDANGVTLNVASSIWADDLKPCYVRYEEETRRAGAYGQPDSYEPINDWIEEETNGLIQDFMPVYPGPSGPTLVSTVLFNATWSEIFDPDYTIDEEFTFRDGTRQMGRFMHDLRYLEVINFNDQSPALRDASAVLLDYGFGLTEFTAMFVLPADETEEAMDDVIFGLQEQSLSDLLNDTFIQEVKLSLPRFEVSFGPSSLKDELQNMGIEDAFDGSTYNKFDEMSKDDLLTVQDVLTGTTIRVTERGTEASAVTVVTMVGSARPSKVIDMNFNRPFVMSIIHKPTGTPIFIGRIEQPDLILEDPEVENKDDDYWA